VKNILLAALALVIACVMGMQFLAREAFIPEGHRTLVIAQSIGVAALVISLFSLLYLIPKKNRTFGHFLKAFVAVGAVSSLGQCSVWLNKFNGPIETIISNDGLIAVEVPSDWSPMKDVPDGVNLAVADWASTGMLTVRAQLAADTDLTQDDVDVGLAAVGADSLAKGATVLGDVACGALCAARAFSVPISGTVRRVVIAIKGDGKRMLLITAARIGVDSPAHQEAQLAMIRSARVAAPPKAG
jgi:hypothetical protein